MSGPDASGNPGVRIEPAASPTIGFIDWAHLIEDYLDHIGIDLDELRTQFVGAWMVQYIKALKTVGVDTVWYTVTARVDAPTWTVHQPTGARMCMLPSPRIYRAVRSRVLNPYATSLTRAVGRRRGWQRPYFRVLKEVAPYLSTPVVAFSREFRRGRCGVLLCQEYENARFDACVVLGRRLGVPVFATFQGGNSQLSVLERFARPFAIRAAAGLIIATQSEALRVKDVYNVNDERIAPIFNPVDLSEWYGVNKHEAREALGIPVDAHVVVWHGRVDIGHKGLDVLIRAWRTLVSGGQVSRPLLLLVGTGKDAQRLRGLIGAQTAAEIRWEDRFVGDRAELRRLLGAGDAYALPSNHEGFPVALVEAMACGLPVVATDAEGVADILGNGEESSGVMVRRGDPEGIASALIRILTEPDRARMMGLRARQRAQAAFSLEAVGQRLRDFMLPAGVGINGRS
jgi:starch synthase